MLLIIELCFGTLLVAVLFFLLKDEKKLLKKIIPIAHVEEYWNGKERRRYYRFKEVLAVEYTVEKKTHLAKNGSSIDISERGVKLRLDEKLVPGMIVNLRLNIPESSHNVQIEGEIVWTDDIKQDGASDKRFFHVGVKFLAIKEPARSRFLEYLRSLALEASAY